MRHENIAVPDKANKDSLIKNIFEENNDSEEKQMYSGLCTNCDERLYCKIRNNTSVIWHCEEYK